MKTERDNESIELLDAMDRVSAILTGMDRALVNGKTIPRRYTPDKLRQANEELLRRWEKWRAGEA